MVVCPPTTAAHTAPNSARAVWAWLRAQRQQKQRDSSGEVHHDTALARDWELEGHPSSAGGVDPQNTPAHSKKWTRYRRLSTARI